MFVCVFVCSVCVCVCSCVCVCLFCDCELVSLIFSFSLSVTQSFVSLFLLMNARIFLLIVGSGCRLILLSEREYVRDLAIFRKTFSGPCDGNHGALFC